MLVVAACGEANVTPSVASPTDGAGSSPTAATPSESPTDEPAPTEEPAPTDEPVPTETPQPSADVSPGPTASDGGAAGVCAGTDDNRLFFEKVATSVDWPVYCPVLPAGWFVDAGEYKSAGGGWMTISYKGPGGARLALSEGFFCSADDGCVPDGQDVGPASFGDLDGTLVVSADGRHTVVVDRGSAPSWVVIGSGIDVDTFTGLVADFTVVAG